MPVARGHRTRRTVLLVAVAVFFGTAVAGCAGTPTDVPGSDRPPSAVAPQPFVDLECTDILTAGEVSDALRNPVPLLPAVKWTELGSNAGPASFAVRQSGGIECEWSNGKAPATGTASSKDYVGIVVRVLPNAADHWSRYADYYSVDGTEKLGCDTVDLSGPCSIDSLFGNTWVQVAAWGLNSDGEAARTASMRRIADIVRRSIEAANANTVTWSPPPGTIALDNRCDEFFSAADVNAALGLTDALYLSGMDGGVSLISSGWSEANAQPCPWATPDGLGVGGGLRMLPGGEWAWDLTRAGGDPADYRAVTIPGLAPEDSAFTRCSTAGYCTVDIVAGHNWVQLYLDQGADRVDSTRTALLTLATKTVHSIRT